MVVLNGALFCLRVGRKHHERGVAAVFVRLWVVGEDGAGDGEHVCTLGAVFGGEEHVDEVVVLPAFGGVDTGKGLLFVAQFGGEGVVGFALPGVLGELVHDLVSVGLVLGSMYMGRWGIKRYLLRSSGSLPSLISEMLRFWMGCISFEDFPIMLDS